MSDFGNTMLPPPKFDLMFNTKVRTGIGKSDPPSLMPRDRYNKSKQKSIRIFCSICPFRPFSPRASES
ncbi:hypothetical protein N7455_005659 [Penicillium solitum]|uniref:uncharacterized protein n=1 Tax=Penicillium solitum TaxID=60172 RepID=UPI0032C4A57E|nr:hypothetical protein N7455_005659 [Penicillium solitum]